MGTKYTISSETTKLVSVNGMPCGLYQIQAVRDIPSIGVKAGDLGGHVATKDNLSQDGDCWVFQGSTVYQQGRVLEDAVIYGNSAVGSGSQVKGKAMVEDGVILNESIIEDDVTIQKSRVKKCWLWDKVSVQDSEITDVVANKGLLLKSTLISHGGTLEIKEKINLERCELELFDANPVIQAEGNLKSVTAKNLEIFRLNGSFDIKDVTFAGKSKLTVVVNEAPNDKTVIENSDGECTFTDADLRLINSVIKGAVSVSGKVVLRNSELLDLATVQNDSPTPLFLTNVQVAELAMIRKHKSRLSITIEGYQIGADTLVNC